MVVVVTGANRGLGLGVAQYFAEKGNTVIMTARNYSSLNSAIEKLKAKHFDVHPIEMDVTSSGSVRAACTKILADFKKIDILINNAGVYNDGLSEDVTELSATIEKTLKTNSIGPALVIQAVLPSMKKSGFGRIVNVSSGMGSLSEMSGGFLAYRMSKSALNAVTKVYAAEAASSNIKVNSVCPGWVKTDMGGPGASREIKEGVASIVWAAELDSNGPSGGFFRDGKPVAW